MACRASRSRTDTPPRHRAQVGQDKPAGDIRKRTTSGRHGPGSDRDGEGAFHS